MIFVGFRWDVGESGESELAMLGNGRRGRDLGRDMVLTDRLRLGWGRVRGACVPSSIKGRASGEETEGRDANVVAGGRK